MLTLTKREFQDSLQEQSFTDVLYKTCFENIRNIHKETLALEFLFTKAAVPLPNFLKFLNALFLQYSPELLLVSLCWTKVKGSV